MGEGRDLKRSKCCLSGGTQEKFLEPCLLLLLKKEQDHGYNLLERLKRYGFNNRGPDSGILYRTLRRMEEQGFLTSYWKEGDSGPLKRVYRITGEGEKLLSEGIERIQKNHERIKTFLKDAEDVL